MSRPPSTEKKKRLNFELSPAAMARLQRLTALGGHASMTETVRIAISAYEKVLVQQQSGGEIVFKNTDGTEHSVVFLL